MFRLPKSRLDQRTSSAIASAMAPAMSPTVVPAVASAVWTLSVELTLQSNPRNTLFGFVDD